MKEVVCALDLGTTRIKAALVDREGEVLSLAGGPAPDPLDEGLAFDAREALGAAVAVIRQALAQFPEPHRVVALAVTNQRATFVPVDEEAVPVGPALSWQDTRCAADADDWFDRVGRERFTTVTGLPPSALWSVGKVLWLRRVHPEVWSRTRGIALLHDLLLARLGCQGLCTDPSNASVTGLFDLAAGTWSAELLDAAACPRALLPRLRPAGTVAGHVSAEAAEATGLPMGTPLVVGGGDQQCAALGIGVTRPGEAGLCLGTAAVVSCPVERPAPDPKGRHFCTAHAVQGRFVLEGIHNTFGSALAWIQQLLGLETPRELDRLAEEAPPASNGLLFLPHLAGIGSPDFAAAARGRLVGLDLAHRRPHVARAAFEGIAFELRRILDNMADVVTVQELTITGGGSSGPVLPRILADATGRTLRQHPATEATILGAALLAWHGAGTSADLPAMARSWSRSGGGTLEPAKLPLLEDAYGRYLDAVSRSLQTRSPRQVSP